MIALLGGVTLLAAAQAKSPAPDGLYLFFTPGSPGIVRLATRLGAVELRPVLLLEEARRPLPDSFADAVKALGRPLQVVDPEGLALARAFGVTRVPCLVRVRHGRVHMAVGSDLSIEEVTSCSR